MIQWIYFSIHSPFWFMVDNRADPSLYSAFAILLPEETIHLLSIRSTYPANR
jgi:hypothetical protein